MHPKVLAQTRISLHRFLEPRSGNVPAAVRVNDAEYLLSFSVRIRGGKPAMDIRPWDDVYMSSQSIRIILVVLCAVHPIIARPATSTSTGEETHGIPHRVVLINH